MTTSAAAAPCGDPLCPLCGDRTLFAASYGRLSMPSATYTRLDDPWALPSRYIVPPAMPAKTPPRLERVTGTEVIVGYRSWRLVRRYPDGVKLVSLNSGIPWPACERMDATCSPSGLMRALYPGERSPHDAPGADCDCGVYAHRDGVDLADGLTVVGAVNLWGRVIEHETGYRAQYAYPKTLALVNGGTHAKRLADALELAYAVPCEVW